MGLPRRTPTIGGVADLGGNGGQWPEPPGAIPLARNDPRRRPVRVFPGGTPDDWQSAHRRARDTVPDGRVWRWLAVALRRHRDCAPDGDVRPVPVGGLAC